MPTSPSTLPSVSRLPSSGSTSNKTNPVTPPSGYSPLRGTSQTSSPPWTPTSISVYSLHSSNASDVSSILIPSTPATPQIQSIPLPSLQSPSLQPGLITPPLSPTTNPHPSSQSRARPRAPANTIHPPSSLPTPAIPPRASLLFGTPSPLVRTLNPILELPAFNSVLSLPIIFDLTFPSSFSSIQVSPVSQYLPPTHGCRTSMLSEPAVYPPLNSLIIHLPGLPEWTFTVTAPPSTSHLPQPHLSASDVLRTLAYELHRPTAQATWANYQEPLRSGSARAFHTRSSIDPSARVAGLKRVDFLMGRTLFAGLREKRSRSGEWEAVFFARNQA